MMNNKIFKGAKLALFSLVVCVFISQVSYAIVSLDPINSVDTPIITSEFERQIQDYVKRYKISLPLDPKIPVDVTHFPGNIFGDKADTAFKEIRYSEEKFHGDEILKLVLNESELMYKSLKERGFVPTVSNLINHKVFSFSYLLNFGIGPTPSVNDATKSVESYTHILRFDYILNYQKKGQELRSQSPYPSVKVQGIVVLNCKKTFEQCQITNVTVDEALIKWQVIPGPRGGNSSSGGGF